jgi:hypothetical protein
MHSELVPNLVRIPVEFGIVTYMLMNNVNEMGTNFWTGQDLRLRPLVRCSLRQGTSYGFYH